MIGKIIDNYQILHQIGSGAFGHTYKVRKNDIIYAMKILKPEALGNEYQAGGFKRFNREIRSLQKVNSPYIVKYFDNGVWIDNEIEHYYIIMEYVSGNDFQKYLKKNKDTLINNEELLKIILGGILNGLSAIHKNNIIHRDLKPANIFICDNYQVKLLDFGLVKMLDYSSITTHGKLVGTPLFMSPKIIEGKQIDFRSDLYSFGVLLYYFFTGEYPFTGENIFVLLNNIIKNPPQRICDIYPNISNIFENLILKLLEKQPYLRPFQNAEELKNVILDIPLFKTKIDIKKETDKSYKKKKYFCRLLHNEKTELKKFLIDNGKIDGIEYPANFLPKYKNQLDDLNHFKLKYFFDPSTNRLAYSKFSETDGLKNLPYVYDKFNRITPKKFETISKIKSYTEDVLKWQLRWDTDFLVSPFHFSKFLSDPWLSTDLKLLEESFSFKQRLNLKKDIYAGICIDIEDLTDEENRLELINKYSRILPDGFIFYIDKINERTSNAAQLYSYIDLLLKFKQLKRPVIAARVGSLGLGLLELGIDAFTQGIAALSSFSEESLLANRPTGYKMQKKFYLPDLLLTLNVNIAVEILNKFPKLRCNCKFCNNYYDLFSLSKSAKCHFLEIRSKEIQSINSGNYNFINHIETAKRNIQLIRKANIKLSQTNHLSVWTEVFSQFLG